ncbi:MAG TPA: hypothetical protein VKU82_00825 [Planctomycetaceae bacterium]|nr:hypothetical protein [Planctomycetaceae bacterium]
MCLVRCGRLSLQLWLGLAFWQGLACSLFGDEKGAGPQVRYSAVRAATGGLYTFVPEKWSVLDLEVSNPADEPRELLTTTYFDETPTLQYGRRLWLPARSKLTTWFPVLPPKPAAGARGNYSFHSLVLDPTRAEEVLGREAAGSKLHSGTAPIQLDFPITGLIAAEGAKPGEDASAAYDLVVAGRSSQKLTQKVTNYGDRFFAPDEFSLQAVDQLVICDNRVLNDPAGLAAVRRWTYAGGQLWVLLDRVDPQVLETILGDEFVCHLVDRVSLTTVRMKSAKAAGLPPIETDYETPVDLVRVLIAEDDVDLAYVVDGWPAAFWKSFGAGRVLVTTLAPHGWLRPKMKHDQQAEIELLKLLKGIGREVELFRTPFVALPPMEDLAKSFYTSVSRPPLVSESLEPQAGEYVGYSIPSFKLIGGLLTGFGALVVVLGCWLLRARLLEHLGWLGPSLAVAAAGVLLAIGGLNRHSIQSTAAVVQFVQAIPGTDDVRSQGAAVFYSPELGPWTIQGHDGGRLMPDMSGLEGTTRRLVWSDLDTWAWENLTQIAPQRTARFSESRTIADRFEARGTLDSGGIVGRFSAGRADAYSDALIATRFGRIGVSLNPDGTFRARADNVFGKDQYLESNLLSDEQDRRRRTFAHVLNDLERREWSGPPLLLAWTDRWDSGFQFDDQRRLRGASLLSIPLVLERPPNGSPVAIPAPLLPYRATPLPDGTPSSPLWDHRRHEWHEKAGPANLWLRFQIPSNLLPITLTHARLVVQVIGPLGRFEVSGLEKGEAVSIKRWENPVGTLTIDVADRRMLQTHDEGALVFGFTVGEPAPPGSVPPEESPELKQSIWKIESLSLELMGTTASTAQPADADGEETK